MKPALKELVEAAVEETEPGNLSNFRLSMQIVVVIPDYSRTLCPICGGPTRCHHSYYIHPQDIDLARPTVLQVYR
ncbi:MAG: hypothetical protein JXB07_08515, partial [Anaerolineae bacterium]|nr:hypothetical protein [Anaerolineae bacterium]